MANIDLTAYVDIQIQPNEKVNNEHFHKKRFASPHYLAKRRDGFSSGKNTTNMPSSQPYLLSIRGLSRGGIPVVTCDNFLTLQPSSL